MQKQGSENLGMYPNESPPPSTETDPLKDSSLQQIEAVGETIITFNAVEKKVKLRVDSGYDLDKYLYKESSPLNFYIDTNGFQPHPTEPSKVTLRVWDVDQYGAPGVKPEIDKVYVNGVCLGVLTGANNQWSQCTFNIPAGTLKTGENHFQVFIDLNDAGWAVEVDWAEIEIPFNIAHTESRTYNDVDIEYQQTYASSSTPALITDSGSGENVYPRANPDDAEGNLIWKVSFDSNGNATIKESDNPIADNTTGLLGFVSRKFKYEYTIEAWPSIGKPDWVPTITSRWEIWSTSEDQSPTKKLSPSDTNKTLVGWEKEVDVVIPERVGKYTLIMVLDIYRDKTLLKTESCRHTLYVLHNKPVASIIKSIMSPIGIKIDKPLIDWLDLATKWAVNQGTVEGSLKALTQKIHNNEFGWEYGYLDSEWSVVVAPILIRDRNNPNRPRRGNCYCYREVWRLLAAALGIETGISDYRLKDGKGNILAFLSETKASLDGNKKVNALGNPNRWLFISHALGYLAPYYYDPTFGVISLDREENVYAKQIECNKEEYFVVKSPQNKVRVKDMKRRNDYYWKVYEYEDIKSRNDIDSVSSKDSAARLDPANAIGFTGLFTEKLVDDDNNGLNEYLRVDIEINSDQNGIYTVDPTLLSTGGDLINIGGLLPGYDTDFSDTADMIELKEGKKYVPIYFSGQSIRTSEVDGPYTVSVRLYDNTGSLLDDTSFSTAPYEANEFQGILFENTGISDFGTDENSDGLFDFLTVDVNMNILAAGNFTLYGMLFSGNTFLDSTTVNQSMTSGSKTVSLNFDGKVIRNKGLNGPYTLYLNLSDQRYSLEVKHTTGTYDYTSFQTAKAYFTGSTTDSGIDKNNNGLYDELHVKTVVTTSEQGTYTVYGILQDNAGEIIEFTKETVALNETPTEVLLIYNGTAIHQHNVNGPYQVILVLKDDNDSELAGYEYSTGDYACTDFEGSKASLGISFSDKGVDSNSDGYYDTLDIEVEVNVAEGGVYTVQGSLTDSSGNFITAAKTELQLGTGANIVTLKFDGEAIRHNGTDGPYTLISAEIHQEDFKTIDYKFNPYCTGYYSYKKFKWSDMLTGEFSDQGEDINQNGLFDTLLVNAEASVPMSDNYNFNARLVDRNGTEIVWTSGSQQLDQGIQTVSLGFDGRYIYGNGVNGPYRLEDLSIYSNSNMYIMSGAYYTKAYQYDEFEPCSIVRGKVTADGNPVANANIFINNVNSNFTNENGEYRLTVINGGTYEINISADPALAPWQILVDKIRIAVGTSATIDIPAGKQVEVDFISKTNHPPVLEPIGNKTVSENKLLLFMVKATDPDGDAIAYSTSNQPEGASFDSATGVFSWIPDYSQAGVYRILFGVTDQKLSSSEEIAITVVDVRADDLLSDLISYMKSLKPNTNQKKHFVAMLELAKKKVEKYEGKLAIQVLTRLIEKVREVQKMNRKTDRIIKHLEDLIDKKAGPIEMNAIIKEIYLPPGNLYLPPIGGLRGLEKGITDSKEMPKKLLEYLKKEKALSLSDEEAEYLIKKTKEIICIVLNDLL